VSSFSKGGGPLAVADLFKNISHATQNPRLSKYGHRPNFIRKYLLETDEMSLE